MELKYIAQDNRITTARYELGLVEKRIMYLLIAEIRNKYVLNPDGQRDLFDNLVIQMPIKEILKAGSNRSDVREGLKSLRLRSFEYSHLDEEHPEHSWFECGFINYGKWDASGIEVEVSKQILPFFVELTKRYTSYSLLVAISLKSKWSQRIYELCSKWRSAGGFQLSVVELRNMFDLQTKYKKYAILKERVIETAQKELKALYDLGQSDIYFNYSEHKDGQRGVQRLVFKVISSTQIEMQMTDDDRMYYIRTELKNIFETDKKHKNQVFVGSVLQKLTIETDLIKPLYSKIEYVQKNYPNEDHARYLRVVINEDYLNKPSNRVAKVKVTKPKKSITNQVQLDLNDMITKMTDKGSN